MSIRKKVAALETKRDKMVRKIDAEIAKLQVLCDHTNTKSYPSRPGDSSTECLDCGEWW